MTTKHLIDWRDWDEEEMQTAHQTICGIFVYSYDEVTVAKDDIHLVTCLRCLEHVRDHGLLAQSRLDELTLGGVL